MATTTIVIPTYFAGQMLHNCIESILQNVSNPKILVYKNSDGWLQACNKLMSETTDDIILLNDDTIVLTDIVREMQQLAYSDPKIGIVGAKMLSPNQETVINYGIRIAKDGNSAHKHFGEHKSKVNKVEIQKAVEGSCMYIKRDVLTQIGYFDTNYGMGYREEVDLAFTAREADWKVVSCPTAEVVHFVSQTHGRLNITNDTHKYFMSKWGTKLALGKV
jgi:O-antigen biosynthesis protein